MKRPVIVLVSVLKPIDDTRMYEKIGLSLGQSNKYDVNIIGFRANKPEYAPNINFFPLPFFKRLSFRRFFCQWTILRQLIRLRPSLTILSAAELLPLAFWCKLLGSKVIYDVRENYALNLRSQKNYSSLVRTILSAGIRLTERIFGLFADHFLLAETVYAKQMYFPGPVSVLENKYTGTAPAGHSPATYQTILFSGTLGRHTGVLQAIRWTGKLHERDPSVRLHICGYAPDQEFRDELVTLASESPWVKLTGADKLVPHAEIIEAIHNADAGIIWYNDHPSTRGKVPTKLYEYLSLELPIIMEPRDEWLALTTSYNAAIPADLKKDPETDFMERWKSSVFYTEKPGQEVHWAGEEEKLMTVVNNVLKEN